MGLILGYVALGGATGSVARYLVSAALQRATGSEFPVWTLVVNVTGSILLGFLMGYLLARGSASAETRALLTTGFCGGYTTFSTFSYEVVALMQRGDFRRASIYVALSVALSIGGVMAGMGLARQAVVASRKDPPVVS